MWLCKAQYEIISENVKACSLFQVISERVGPLTNVHCIVQNKMWKCKNVHMLIVCLRSGLCTNSRRCVRQLHTSHICIHIHIWYRHRRIPHLDKFSSSLFVHMHIWNAQVPKLSTSLTARLLCHFDCQSCFSLRIYYSMINPYKFYTEISSCSPPDAQTCCKVERRTIPSWSVSNVNSQLVCGEHEDISV
jgi:hypothetical protein